MTDSVPWLRQFVRWSLNYRGEVHVWVSSYGICGRKESIRTDFPPSISVFPISIIPPLLHIHSYIVWGLNNWPVSCHCSVQNVSSHRKSNYVSVQLQPLADPLAIPKVISEIIRIISRILSAETEGLREKPVPVILFQPQTLHRLPWERTRYSVVINRLSYDTAQSLNY
jgi:hypothetical protein